MRSLLASILILFSVDAFAVTTGPNAGGNKSYAPSCLAYPTEFDMPSGPTYSHAATFDVLDRATLQRVGFETVDFTFWRVACANGRSALLLRISRAANADGNRAVQFPPVSGLGVSQGSLSGWARLAQEPNTYASNLP